MSNDGIDRFDDIQENYRGMFDKNEAGLRPALEEFESMEERIEKTGPVLSFRCQGCGTTLDYKLEWPELIALKFRVSPHLAGIGGLLQHGEPSVWQHVSGRGTWKLIQRCPQCGWKLLPEIRHGQPEEWLKRGRREGYVNPDMESRLQQHCQKVYAAAISKKRMLQGR